MPIPMKDISVEDALKSLISGALTKEYSDDNGPTGAHWPSSGFGCTRKIALQAQDGYTFNADATGKLRMSIGGTTEYTLKRFFKEDMLLLFDEIYAPKSEYIPKFSGRVDFVLWSNVLNAPILMELKSCPSDWKLAEPRVAHMEQAKAYSAMTGLHTALVYVPRECRYVGKGVKNEYGVTEFQRAPYNDPITLAHQTFVFPYEEEDAIKTLEKLAQAHIFIERGDLPRTRLPLKKHCDARYCQFKKACWGTEYDDRTVSWETEEEVSDHAADRALQILNETPKRQKVFFKELATKSQLFRELSGWDD